MVHLQALQAIDRAVPGLAAVYGFGSLARGEGRPDSDMDIAVVARAPLSSDLIATVRELLEAAVGRDVDLIDLRQAPLPLAQEVMRDGVRLLTRDALAADLLEVQLMRDYDDLKRRRAGIEADIRVRGKVLAA